MDEKAIYDKGYADGVANTKWLAYKVCAGVVLLSLIIMFIQIYFLK